MRGPVTIEEGLTIEILPRAADLSVLGTVLSLSDATGAEMENRIAAAWRMFWGMSRLLLNKKCSLNRRLKLFGNTVANCALWCTESWTPRQEELRQLESTRRAMLRRIVGTPRGTEESWLQWIQRSTHKAVAAALQVGVVDWSHLHHLKKWHWAGHVARRGEETWLYKTTFWRDSAWQTVMDGYSLRPLRPSQRRWMRFEDCIRRFFNELGGLPWAQAALDKESWNGNSEMFATWRANPV